MAEEKVWVICFGAIGFILGLMFDYVWQPFGATGPFVTIVVTCLWMYRAPRARRLFLDSVEAAELEKKANEKE